MTCYPPLQVMVGLKGLEPLRPLERQNLNLVRLPIPPQPRLPDFTIPRARDREDILISNEEESCLPID